MKGLFQCPPRATPWVNQLCTIRPERAKALYSPQKRKKQEPAIKLFLAFFDFMLQLLGDYYLLVGILNSLTLEMDLPS